MTKDIIDGLDKVLSRHLCKLSRTSYDEANKVYMCKSELKVVNFDKIPKEYGKVTGALPMSNDALYISQDSKWYFIEFKNGTVDKGDLYRKIYDSLIMLIELEIIEDFKFAREKMNYILVYNEEKYQHKEVQSLAETYEYIEDLAQTESKLFGVDKFEKYLFRNTHTYTKRLFQQRFVVPMEREEGLTG